MEVDLTIKEFSMIYEYNNLSLTSNYSPQDFADNGLDFYEEAGTFWMYWVITIYIYRLFFVSIS